MRKQILFVWVLVLAGCNYNIDKTSPLDPGAGSGDPVAAGDMTFQNVYSVAIKPNCVGCHSAPRNSGGVNLETYQSVFENRGAVNWAVSSRFMPESTGRSMPESARTLLLEWLAAGVPQ